MIHDLLLACLSSSREGQGVKQFLDTTAVEHFFHPCETEIFMGILNIMNVYHEVVEFTQIYSTKPVQMSFADLSHGFYMLNFVKGIESALEESYQEIVRLEADCRKTKRNSLSYVHNALRTKLPMLMLVRKLIMEVKVMKLRGCALLHNLHQQSEHGDPQLERVVQKQVSIIKPVKYAFFSSLAHWMLFGVIDDIHTEFFINFIPLESGQGSTCSKSTQSFISVRVSPPSFYFNNNIIICQSAEQATEDYIWQYEINMKQLPGFLSIISAEKVLFVGQTVLVFKMGRNPKSKNKMDQMAVELNDMSREDIYELWNGRESEFFKTIQDLSNDDKINVFRIEQVVNEIKKFVSRRLSEIAVNEVDLERQMGLLKDFYLLGRGEFFLEFFSQLYGNFDINTEMRSRNYTRAFEVSLSTIFLIIKLNSLQLAATGLRITDDLENFTLSSLRNSEEPDESYDFQVLQSMHLKYIYEWPLNLLFSPKAIERYNKIFRFLLIIRGLQYQMQRVWATQTWTEKAESGGTNIRVMNLRNHLLFFLNNLQYYIQVDVLECQFEIFMNVIRSRSDFEEIQRAHTIFLANVLSQCFLLSDTKDAHLNITACQTQANPIYGTILKLFSICEKFIHMTHSIETEDITEEVVRLEREFGVQIASLIQLLVDIRTSSCLGPLSQLLLRLDFNHWFSQHHCPSDQRA
ncbi:hypothetical protein KR059_002203 [Drosophila kikkawai]|nr:hypothetical protein KR059_002203 [Drosophila kikkawai]